MMSSFSTPAAALCGKSGAALTVLAFAVLIDLADGAPEDPKTVAVRAYLASVMELSESQTLAVIASVAPGGHVAGVQRSELPQGAQKVGGTNVPAGALGKLLRHLDEMIHGGHAEAGAVDCKTQPGGTGHGAVMAA